MLRNNQPKFELAKQVRVLPDARGEGRWFESNIAAERWRLAQLARAAPRYLKYWLSVVTTESR